MLIYTNKLPGRFIHELIHLCAKKVDIRTIIQCMDFRVGALIVLLNMGNTPANALR